MLKKGLLLTIFVLVICNIYTPKLFAGSVADFLFERASEYYKSGNFKEALDELKKVLLVEPTHREARDLIQLIRLEQVEERLAQEEEEEAALKEVIRISEARKAQAILFTLDEAEELLAAEAARKEAEKERKRIEQQKQKEQAVSAALEVKEKSELIEIAAEAERKETQEREIERKIITEEKKEPMITEIEQAIPSEKETVAPKWIIEIKPSEIITSQQLEGYRLFSEGKILIDDQPTDISPVIIKDNDIWLPVDKVAQSLGLVVFSSEKDSLMAIDAEGVPLEFSLGKKEIFVNQVPFLLMPEPLAIYNGNFMLSLHSLTDALGVSFEYFPDTYIVKITKEKKVKFSTFTLEKPKISLEEQEEIEKAQAQIAKPLLPREIKKELLPEEYYPDIDLKLDTSFKYFHDMFEDKRTRYLEYYLSGKMYDIDVFGHLSARDYETDEKRTFQEDAQHLSFFKGGTGIKLLDNYMWLPQVRSQTQAYWGLEFDTEAYPLIDKAWIGEMDAIYIPALEGDSSIKYLGNLYATSQDWIDTEQFHLSAVELFTHSQPEFSQDSGSTAYPKKNFVYLLDSDWQICPELNFYNTFAQCIYVPDNEREVTVSDYDFRSGIELSYERFNLNSSFEYVGDRYVSLGLPSSYQDFIGWDLGTNFRITDHLTLNITGNISRDNVDFDEDAPSSHSRGITTSTNLRLPQNQNLNFGWSYDRYLTRGGTESASGNEYQNYRMDYYKNWETALLQLGWQHYRMDPLASSTEGLLSDTYSATIYRSFPKLHGSYIRLYQDLTKSKELSDDSSAMVTTRNSSLSVKYNLLPSLSLTGDCRVCLTQQDDAEDTSIMSFSTGAEYNLSPATTLGCTYYADGIDLHDKWSTEDWSILLYVRHLFDLRTPEKWGKIIVEVFEDLNGNNIRDLAEEEGLADVLAYVVDGAAAQTNSDGLALIEEVVPGERKVKLDMRKLPLEMVIQGESVKTVIIEPLKTADVAFVVVTTGAIRGRIYIDNNGNGAFDRDLDTPISNMRIFLSPEYQDTLSFSDGSYRFDYAYPGQLKVNLDLAGAPKEYKLVSPESKDVEVKPKETLENVDFIFEGRTLKIKYF